MISQISLGGPMLYPCGRFVLLFLTPHPVPNTIPPRLKVRYFIL
jgi:hypothetical protein